MFLIFLGLVAFFGSLFFKGAGIGLNKFAGIARAMAFLLILLGVATSCVKQIDTGQVGVQTMFGKVQGAALGSGLNFVNPLVEITMFDVKTQNYTMSKVHDEGDQGGDDAIRVLTSDGLEVTIDLTVLFRVIASEAPRILQEIGSDYKDKIVRPVTRTKIRDNAVYYTAVDLYSNKREEFQARIIKSIEDEFKNRGLQLETMLIRNIDLPESVKKAIESKINAEQEAQKMQFVLEKEKQEADRKRVEAQGIADYQKILSTGLTPQLLQYEMIKAQKEIAQSPNAKVVIMGDKSAPFILGN